MIFILGIDALEYELVDKLNLNNLKQLEYSKIIVPLNGEIGLPSSPEVWASFLVGEHMPMNFVSSSPFTATIIKVIEFFHIDLDKGLAKKIKNIFTKLYDFSAPSRFGCLKEKTFLDITNSKEINVPYYSFDHKTFQTAYLFGYNKISLAKAVKETKVIYENRKIQIISLINEINDYDLVFAFMHTTDILQHFSYLHFSEIKKHYIDLDHYISILKRKLETSFEDVIFIIVSDHGFDFDKGTHSMKGFYSSNIHLIPKPEKITDFYGIILDLINESKGLSH